MKRLLRISSQPFVYFSLELSLFSHNIAHLEHSWSTLELEKGRKRKDNKTKGRKNQARKSWIKRLQQDYLQVSSFMYDLLASYMHGICMCVFGSLVVISMGFSRCDIGFQHFFSISG